jgi:hypothetical protein
MLVIISLRSIKQRAPTSRHRGRAQGKTHDEGELSEAGFAHRPCDYSEYGYDYVRRQTYSPQPRRKQTVSSIQKIETPVSDIAIPPLKNHSAACVSEE